MASINEIIISVWNALQPVLPIILLLIGLTVLSLTVRIIRKALLKRAKVKRQVHNIQIFSNILLYSAVVLLIVFVFISYGGTLGNAGLVMGFVSAALGWALQRPITGVAGWMMVIIKKPFKIGDRIIISGVVGDVTDITLTHIYLSEVGGIPSSEEKSGRIILIPNSVLFEQNIINFTAKQEEFVLDEVVFTITHKSDLQKAVKIGVESAKKVSLKYNSTQAPYARTYFAQNGINIHIRYFAPATRRQESTSVLTQEIFDKISKEKEIRFAYQLHEVSVNSSIKTHSQKISKHNP
jgi:small-conductance mechanosensitive channel